MVVAGVVVGVPSVVDVVRLVVVVWSPGVVVDVASVVSVVESRAVVLDEALHGDATASELKRDVKKSEWIRRRAILNDCCRVESNCTGHRFHWRDDTRETPWNATRGGKAFFSSFPFTLNNLG